MIAARRLVGKYPSLTTAYTNATAAFGNPTQRSRAMKEPQVLTLPGAAMVLILLAFV
jgi:hypothetical protein